MVCNIRQSHAANSIINWFSRASYINSSLYLSSWQYGLLVGLVYNCYEFMVIVFFSRAYHLVLRECIGLVSLYILIRCTAIWLFTIMAFVCIWFVLKLLVGTLRYRNPASYYKLKANIINRNSYHHLKDLFKNVL